MHPSTALQTHRDAIREIALRHRVKNVRVFGSVLHGNDTDNKFYFFHMPSRCA